MLLYKRITYNTVYKLKKNVSVIYFNASFQDFQQLRTKTGLHHFVDMVFFILKIIISFQSIHQHIDYARFYVNCSTDISRILNDDFLVVQVSLWFLAPFLYKLMRIKQAINQNHNVCILMESQFYLYENVEEYLWRFERFADTTGANKKSDECNYFLKTPIH